MIGITNLKRLTLSHVEMTLETFSVLIESNKTTLTDLKLKALWSLESLWPALPILSELTHLEIEIDMPSSYHTGDAPQAIRQISKLQWLHIICSNGDGLETPKHYFPSQKDIRLGVCC